MTKPVSANTQGGSDNARHGRRLVRSALHRDQQQLPDAGSRHLELRPLPERSGDHRYRGTPHPQDGTPHLRAPCVHGPRDGEFLSGLRQPASYPCDSHPEDGRAGILSSAVQHANPNERGQAPGGDVGLAQGVLNIRHSKGSSQHYVVLHDTMRDLLPRYHAAIQALNPERDYFFPAPNGSSLTNGWVVYKFRAPWHRYNTPRATAYDLRHHYAVENLNQWIGEGFEFFSKLLLTFWPEVGTCCARRGYPDAIHFFRETWTDSGVMPILSSPLFGHKSLFVIPRHASALDRGSVVCRTVGTSADARPTAASQPPAPAMTGAAPMWSPNHPATSALIGITDTAVAD